MSVCRYTSTLCANRQVSPPRERASAWYVMYVVQVSNYFGKLPKQVLDLGPLAKRAKYCTQYEILPTVISQTRP
jgi:hypothetical protein